MKLIDKLDYLFAGFKVRKQKLNKEYTLGEYIEHILSTYNNKIGLITVTYEIKNNKGYAIGEWVEHHYRYRHGELLDKPNYVYDRLKESKVRKALKCSRPVETIVEDYELTIDYVRLV